MWCSHTNGLFQYWNSHIWGMGAPVTTKPHQGTSDLGREVEVPSDFWEVCGRTGESIPLCKGFSADSHQHTNVSSILAQKRNSPFLHFVGMLHLLQSDRGKVKLLNNSVLNIAGTNNRIRERIKLYLFGFRFGRSQLMTHSPDKLRSGVPWCWPSETGLRSAQQSQPLRVVSAHYLPEQC